MHEIKIKIKGNGTVDTGFRERLRIGVANEINRVKFVFELDVEPEPEPALLFPFPSSSPSGTSTYAENGFTFPPL